LSCRRCRRAVPVSQGDVEQALAFFEGQHRDLGHFLRQLVEPRAGVLQRVVVADGPAEENREDQPEAPLRPDVLATLEGRLDFADREGVDRLVGIPLLEQEQTGFVVRPRCFGESLPRPQLFLRRIEDRDRLRLRTVAALEESDRLVQGFSLCPDPRLQIQIVGDHRRKAHSVRQFDRRFRIRQLVGSERGAGGLAMLLHAGELHLKVGLLLDCFGPIGVVLPNPGAVFFRSCHPQ